MIASPVAAASRRPLAGTAIVAACWLALATGCARPEDARFAEATLSIDNVTIVDAAKARLIAGRTIVLAGDEILAVEDADELELPATVQVVDGTGRYAIPGLWDMHIHAVGEVEDAFQRVLPLLIANGVTGIREMGMTVEKLSLLRDRQAARPDELAPRLVVAGPLLDGVKLPWYGDLPLLLETPEAVEPALENLRALGVDFFKTYDGLSAEVFAEIMHLAGEWRLPVAGHVPDAVAVAAASRAGLHTIEHLGIDFLRDCVNDGDGWFARSIEARFGDAGLDGFHRVNRDFWNEIDWPTCDAMFDTMAAEEVYFTPTLMMVLQDRARIDEADLQFLGDQARAWCTSLLDGIDAADPEIREEHYSQVLSTVGRMREAGIRLLAGSDAENNCLAPGFSLHWELSRLVEAGLEPSEVLRVATLTAAEALGMADRTGSIAVGYGADLVVLRANPLEDVSALQTIEAVVAKGRYFSHEDLARLRQDALIHLAASSSTSP